MKALNQFINVAVAAIDAKTSKQDWKIKVQYPRATPRIVCCGIINRGAALFDGKVFRTTLDANVTALDAGTGKDLRRLVRHARLHRRWDPATGKHL